MAETKTLNCKILDPKSKDLLAKGQIKITQTKPQHKTKSLHVYEGEIDFEEFLPGIDSKSAILELSPDISGKVFLHFAHTPGTSSLGFTTKVFFEDPFWKSAEWFASL